MNVAGNMLESMFERLEKFLRTETVVGEPFQVGDITLVPIITVAFGVGGGEGSGKDNEGNDGSGTGGGMGCKISPNAMIVIKDGEVSVIPLTGRGSLDKLFEMVPDIISKIERKSADEKE